jgi:hypothetical protein
MDTSADARRFRDLSWPGAPETGRAGGPVREPSWPGPAGTSRPLRAVLEDTEARLRRSAGRLRACGKQDQARRVERFASWARFDLDEPLVAYRLYGLAARLPRAGRLEPLANQALEMVLSLARADRGNVQLADPVSGALRIIAQHGFDEAFLDHFTVVEDDGSACGRAARRGAQLVITDVVADAGFTPHRGIAAESGFRAVQSTPILDKTGRVLGVVSTHYPRPYALPARDMRILQRYTDMVGHVLAALPARTSRAVAPASRLPAR